jgi:hypothetical protein
LWRGRPFPDEPGQAAAVHGTIHAQGQFQTDADDGQDGGGHEAKPARIAAEEEKPEEAQAERKQDYGGLGPELDVAVEVGLQFQESKGEGGEKGHAGRKPEAVAARGGYGRSG